MELTSRRALAATFALLLLMIGAHAQTFNAAQTDSGLTVTATSTFNSNFLPDFAVNGDTTGTYADGRPTRGWWNNGNAERFGTSSLTLSFGRALGYYVRRIEVVSVRNDFNVEREPAVTEDGVYVVRDFDILISRNGVDYALACAVRNNTKVVRGCDLDPFNTVRYIRITALASADGNYRIAEVRALAKE